MAKKKNDLDVVETLFDMTECLEEAANNYADTASPENRKALRAAAINYAVAARQLEESAF